LVWWITRLDSCLDGDGILTGMGGPCTKAIVPSRLCRYLPTYKEAEIDNEGRGGAAATKSWKRQYAEKEPSERVTDEIHEATMIHTKTLDFGQTGVNRCHVDSKRKWLGCFIGFPWPKSYDSV
jgi:hypothetical protein